jgi:microcin C transport system substrate-binding protein
MRHLAWLLSACLGTAAWAAPGYAVWGSFKYAPGFTHLEYVNPNAPKGGELRMVAGSRISTFDKYNPFTLKGNSPSFLESVMFESLLTEPIDEVGVGYGLLAEDVEVAADLMSASGARRASTTATRSPPATSSTAMKR